MSWRFFALLAGCVLLGCGGDDGGTTSSGGSSGAGGASGTGGVATGGTGGVATGGTGGVATGGTGGGATGGTGCVATGGTGGATGGTSGGPSSASYRLSAPKRVLHGTVTTSAGGLVVAQSTPSASKTELLHFDSSGQLQWAQQYISPGSFYFRLDAGARRAAGGYAFSGTSNLNTGPGVVTAITATGQLDWAKSYAAFVWFTRIHPTADGGFFASGSASAKYGVVRLDAQGNVKWGSNYTPPGTGSVFDTTVTSDDGIAFVGAVPSSGELLIAKLDSKGTQRAGLRQLAGGELFVPAFGRRGLWRSIGGPRGPRENSDFPMEV